MEYVGEAFVRPYVFDDVRNRAYSLERDSGERIEGGCVAEARGREAEHHDGCCTEVIDNYFASVGNKGLGLVDVQYIDPRA